MGVLVGVAVGVFVGLLVGVTVGIGVFVGSGIFKSDNPAKRAVAIVRATTHYNDPAMLAEISKGLGAPMSGRSVSELAESELLAKRGW